MTKDLLERHIAQRPPSGAKPVWAEIQRTLAQKGEIVVPMPELDSLRDTHAPQGQQSWAPWLYRAAVAALVVGIGAVLISNVGGQTNISPADQNVEQPFIRTGNEPLPAPYAIGDRPLFNVTQPRSPLFDADDVFGEGELIEHNVRPDELWQQVVVYAESDTAFDGPIFVLEFDSRQSRSGFAFRGIHIDDAEQNGFVDLVEETPDGGVALPPESGLIEVARMSRAELWDATTSWWFSFGNLDQSFNIGAQAMDNPTPWLEISTVLSDGASARPIEIEPLGISGVELVTVDLHPLSALWVEDGFLYTLTGFATGDRTADALDELQRIDRSTWVANTQAALAGEVVPDDPLSDTEWLILIGGPLLLFVLWRFRPKPRLDSSPA